MAEIKTHLQVEIEDLKEDVSSHLENVVENGETLTPDDIKNELIASYNFLYRLCDVIENSEKVKVSDLNAR